MLYFKNSNIISKKERIFIILHLCIVFTLVSWIMLYPFMGEHFAIKFRSQITESVISSSPFFESLPVEKQEDISHLHHYFTKELKQTFGEKTAIALKHLCIQLPPFERAWIFFSLAICLLLLYRKAGARHAAWLLPTIVIFYGIHNLATPPAPAHFLEQFLPSENYLVEKFLDKPLSINLSQQKQELEKAWKLYLIDTYTVDSPADDSTIFNQQIEKGLFYFRIALANELSKQKNLYDISAYNRKQPMWLLFLFLLWNTLFAFQVSMQRSATTLNKNLA